MEGHQGEEDPATWSRASPSYASFANPSPSTAGVQGPIHTTHVVVQSLKFVHLLQVPSAVCNHADAFPELLLPLLLRNARINQSS